MDNKKTEYEKKYNSKSIGSSYILIAIVDIILIIILTIILKAPITKTGLFQSKSMKGMFAFPVILILMLMNIWLISSIKGIIKGKHTIKKENENAEKNNKYIYYRELPNNYGIGVTTLLFDSAIENYKDIVAIILDLCAKKYLNLTKIEDKYCIKVLKNIDDNLLSNEKYILELLINNDIKNIDYQKWLDLCTQDGIQLGVYNKNDYKPQVIENNAQEIIHKRNITHFLISIVLTIIVFLAYVTNNISEVEKEAGFGYEVIEIVMSAGAISSMTFFLIYGILFIPFYILNVSTGLSQLSKNIQKNHYENEMSNKLIRTEKGLEELQKLYAFRDFINDFGNFVDKQPEEVILWDRYLSYAQVFGLTKEIMNTGYNQLINNSSFQIDDIDNINLEKIEVK